jgi:Uma2 family endonuclease
MDAVKTRLTVQEFDAFIALPENRDRRFELIDGEIIEKTMPTEQHAVLAVRWIMKLGRWIEEHHLGRLAVEPRHRPTVDADFSCIPDIAFTSTARMLPLVTEGAVPQLPDLCIEIQSPDDSIKAMRAKKDDYLAHGVLMVILVFPKQRIIEVYTANDEQLLTMDDTLFGDPVLPGFSIAVKDLFDVV